MWTKDLVNNIAADDLAPDDARSSAATILTV